MKAHSWSWAGRSATAPQATPGRRSSFHRFEDSRSAERLERHLAGWCGILQCRLSQAQGARPARWTCNARLPVGASAPGILQNLKLSPSRRRQPGRSTAWPSYWPLRRRSEAVIHQLVSTPDARLQRRSSANSTAGEKTTCRGSRENQNLPRRLAPTGGLRSFLDRRDINQRESAQRQYMIISFR